MPWCGARQIRAQRGTGVGTLTDAFAYASAAGVTPRIDGTVKTPFRRTPRINRRHGRVQTAGLSDTISGGLGQSARVLNSTSPASYWGGTLTFDVAVSPVGTTYVTVRLWGDDYDDTSDEAASGTNMWRLQLFCEGKQVGHQDQGAVDSLQ